jgi:plasmid stabilization system protein ParE
MYEVRISEPAELDIQSIFDWWRSYRSAEQAERWFEAIYPAIETLSRMPQRCPRARENDSYPGDLRQLLFTIGRRPTHRIIFAIEGDAVIILHVRHTSQRDLRADELA